MFWALMAALGALALGLLVWLKRRFSSLDVDGEDLVRHLQMYDTTDADADDREMKPQRREKYLDLVNNYYNLTTDILHLIWGPHYSTGIQFPMENGKWQSYRACQQMYQCYLGLSLGANENMTIADFGCGTGGPTRCIAQFTGARIKAVNINQKHLAQMKKWNEEFHLDERIEPVCADFHHTPIEGESLDGVYMCESLAHSPDYEQLCQEVFRVLKPGARFTGFNWELTEKYDPSNPEHRRIRHLIEYGVGVCGLVKMSDLTVALEGAGFEILTQRDHNDFGVALGGKRWWYLFEENSLSLQVLFSSMTTILFSGFWALEKLSLVPPATAKAYQELMVALRVGMHEGAKQGIFTPMHYWLARKPLGATPS
jgi:sterol 24-C-methyltransferase